MVEIKYAEMKGVYKILWLRYIYGVDLTNHCMKSLLGHNDKRVRGYMRYLHDLKLEETRWYYLCGVDQNFIWEKNLHLAFVESAGSEIILDNEFIRCHIVNARQVKIDNTSINWSLPQARNKLFNTCRNWWFANWLAKRGAYQAVEQKTLFDDY